MTKDKKSRNWVLTYYPTEEQRDENWFKKLSEKKGIRYFIVGKERCPTTDRLHFQGYIAFTNGKTFKQTKRWFELDRIYIDRAVAGDNKNQAYCEKEGNLLLEVGTPLKQGKRTDIERAVDIIKSTNSVGQVLESVNNYQAVRHAELYLKYKEKKRPVEPIEVIWIYGTSGRGKTKKVYDDNEDVFTPLSYKWWEGYDGHAVVLIDDYRKDFCKYHELLKLLDIYPLRVETKGGSRQVQFNKIYITSCYSPYEMWGHRDGETDGYKQLERRITQTINIDDV